MSHGQLMQGSSTMQLNNNSEETPQIFHFWGCYIQQYTKKKHFNRNSNNSMIIYFWNLLNLHAADIAIEVVKMK